LLLAARQLLWIALEEFCQTEALDEFPMPGDWNARLSSTERLGIKLNCWNTSPRRSLRNSARPESDSSETRASSSLIAPSSAASSPAIKCSSVLLPLPDSPVSATLSPAATERFTPRSTATSSPAAR
jgi:hypothetical protein